MPLKLKPTYKESLTMAGGLGAIGFAVLKGLQMGGAEERVIASVKLLMSEHFARLSDHDCNVLCDTVLARFTKDRRKDGKWYGE